MTCALDFGYSEMSQSPCCGELLCGFEQEKKSKGGNVQYNAHTVFHGKAWTGAGVHGNGKEDIG